MKPLCSVKGRREGGAGAGPGVRENIEPDEGLDGAGAVCVELH